MIYVAVAALLLTLAEGLLFARLIQQQMRAHARREDLLVNQICALAGKPWQPPPARRESVEQVPGPTLYASPEQMTDDDLEPVY